jgi:hypothetical protein
MTLGTGGPSGSDKASPVTLLHQNCEGASESLGRPQPLFRS